MIWVLAAFLVPIITAVLLFFSAADDLWQIITFRINFSRLFDDLAHVLALLALGGVAEMFVLFMLISRVL
ncbi:hypothetical protein [Acidithiobacillus ferridurans]|uniref:Uncharacterized protein n=1 Tax=Acidithiobacillus ferridurans TaxID=1232575 RepID=A0A8X8GAJ8_ACIFI|nr:hypothetical protein [Acidithiobacillus ferridurans]MBU2715842.1 hypothetical protein [Acidithiobacillus ferridurans]MBU2722839.1 hypothetical protein [Acidithiobacillus ferridurans]MBU2727774.1 hypothetical protein [Acidithiobacillus ferridurans]